MVQLSKREQERLEESKKNWMTVSDLQDVLKTLPADRVICIGLCRLCLVPVLSLEGPQGKCPRCQEETNLRPMEKAYRQGG